MNKNFIKLVVFLSLFSAPAKAHHALEYIVVESYTTPPSETGVFYLAYDHFTKDYNKRTSYNYEITPGFAYGITSWLMLSLHTHVSKFGDKESPPFLEVFAGSIQARITEKGVLPIDIGASIGYEYPTPTSRDLIEGTDALALTLILSRDFGAHTNIVLNFTYSTEISLGSAEEFTYGVGFKTPLSADPHGPAGGIEVMGDFSKDPYITILPGVYLPIIEGAIFKTGIGYTFNDPESKLSTHFALVYML